MEIHEKSRLRAWIRRRNQGLIEELEVVEGEHAEWDRDQDQENEEGEPEGCHQPAVAAPRRSSLAHIWLFYSVLWPFKALDPLSGACGVGFKAFPRPPKQVFRPRRLPVQLKHLSPSLKTQIATKRATQQTSELFARPFFKPREPGH